MAEAPNLTGIECVLLADDEEISREYLAEALRMFGLRVVDVKDGEAAIEAMRGQAFDCIFTDLQMPRADGMAVLATAKAEDPDRPVVLVTAHGSMDVAIELMRKGADDILEKPVSVDDLELALIRVAERSRLRRENRYFRDRSVGEDMIWSSPIMDDLMGMIEKVGPSRATVLISGESGTGKERIAAQVHRASDRNTGAFLKINCAAVPENLMESEFFGHEAGAFTGATKRREGAFELTDGGTLFLDEVGEMPLSLQAKLLRVIQEGEFTRVGGSRCNKVDVRIIAASNRDISAEVRAGRFREDLYYRLNVVPIRVPTLRERREEIVPLARHFLSRGIFLSTDAEQVLLAHAWPGNVRELQNLIQRACLLCRDDIIDAGLLRSWIESSDLSSARSEVAPSKLVGRSLRQVEEEMIQETLDACGGNRTRAAKMLGIGVRTLFNKLKTEPSVANA